MMDGASLYPNGFHPSWKEMDPGLLTDARYIHRRDADGVKYYFIDFGISSVFEDATEKRLVLGMWGRDRNIPELSLTDEYDPFPVDIRILGHVYRDFFTSVSTSFREHTSMNSATDISLEIYEHGISYAPHRVHDTI